MLQPVSYQQLYDDDTLEDIMSANVSTTDLNRELQDKELDTVAGGTVNETLNNTLLKVGDAITAGLTFGVAFVETGDAALASAIATPKPR